MPVSQVSVVLPLFGDHIAMETLWLQQDVPCEVVVAVADGTKIPPLGEGAADGRIRIVPADRGSISPGPLRNLAVAASRAAVLYLSDADVVPLGGGFVGQALELMQDQALIQPWMYRLVNPAEAAAGPPFEVSGRGRACHVSVDAQGRLVPVGSERFTWLSHALMLVEPPPGIGWLKEDGTPWLAFPFHWGGILVRRETFDAVGGYCTRYVGWGCEDEDLITKLEGRVGIVRAFKAAPRRLACLHFEHPRSHESAHIQANQAILVERCTAGVDAMIEEDR
jgi:hypothetical protein